MRYRRWMLVLWLLMPIARADVLLDGEQHIGDDTGGGFVPADYVTRSEVLVAPSRFLLTDPITVTQVRLNGMQVQNTAANLTVYIDGTARAVASATSNLVTLTAPAALAAGVHSIAVEAGCLNNGGRPRDCSSPAAREDNDLGFSSLTLVTSPPADTTAAFNLNRRYHIGDSTETGGGTPYGGRWYPDPPDGSTINRSFSLSVPANLTEIRLHGVRDVLASCTGNCLSLTRAVIRVDGVQVATIDTDGDLVLTPSAIGPLAAGPHSLSVTVGEVRNCSGFFGCLFGIVDSIDQDDISWDDLILRFQPLVVPAEPGRFNAVEPAADPVAGPIFTQVAGSAITLDIAALNVTGDALRSGYDGEVEVYLIDAADDSGVLDPATGCRSTWGGQVDMLLGSVDFTGANPVTVTLPAYADALRAARIRLVGNRQQGGSEQDTACSTDSFAVRPDTFWVSASDDDPVSPGTARTLDALSAGAGPVHRAGRPFTVAAEARNADGQVTPGYDGAPALAVEAPVLGANAGAISAAGWSTAGGLARSDQVSYSEVGAFTLRVADENFSAVDDGDGTPLARRRIGPVTLDVGRFVPDDFQVDYNTPVFETACGAFTYLGQPFGFATPAVATVTAVNAAGAVTANYTGALFKLDSGSLTNKQYQELSQPLPVDQGAIPPGDPAVTDNGDGSATVSFDVASGIAIQRSSPREPFDAVISLSADLQDDDGIAYSGNPLRFDGNPPGTGIAFDNGAQMRFGRLVLRNAYGSELLDLPVPARVEYYADLGGDSGFTISADDGCTTGAGVALTDVALSPGAPGDDTHSLTAVTDITLGGGSGSVMLAAPGQAGDVAVSWDLLPSYFWLQVDADGDGVFQENPQARATFGLFSAGERRIDQRETFP